MTMCFDATKLKVLNFYLPQMGLSVEDELKKHLDQLFEERIPENIRQFIQYQTGGQTVGETAVNLILRLIFVICFTSCVLCCFITLCDLPEPADYRKRRGVFKSKV